MPISERRLNIRFIKEHLEKMQEIRDSNKTVTADKPLMLNPNIDILNSSNATYSSTVKSKK